MAYEFLHSPEAAALLWMWAAAMKSALAISLNSLCRQIEFHRVIVQSRTLGRIFSTRHDTDSREQFVKRERLAQVIIRAAIERSHAIRNGVARGEEKHRRPISRLSQTLQHREPVGPR
jgi:hypothetical protein